jgi:glyoxylase-like metal-dependent hydrolase (beta-lactamase superfamily II)
MEIAQGIHRIDGVRGANSYLTFSEAGTAVIDTGMPGNERRIAAYLQKTVAAVKLGTIIITHPDIDHAGSAAKLRALTGAKLAIHEADAPRIAGETKLKDVKGPAGVFIGAMTRLMRFTPVAPDALLRDSDRVEGLTVIHTPGHTDGSICLHLEGRAMFVGDALRTDSKAAPRLPPAGMTADMDRAKESIKRLSQYEYGLLLPGHGPPIMRDASAAIRDFVKGGLGSG